MLFVLSWNIFGPPSFPRSGTLEYPVLLCSKISYRVQEPLTFIKSSDWVSSSKLSDQCGYDRCPAKGNVGDQHRQFLPLHRRLGLMASGIFMRFRMVSVDAVSVDAVSVDAGIWSQRVFMAELVAPRLFPEKLVNLPSGTQKRIKS